MKTNGTKFTMPPTDYLDSTIDAPPSVTQDIPSIEISSRLRDNPILIASLAWEEAHWREYHAKQNYAKYGPYDSFQKGYRVAYEGYFKLGIAGIDFSDVEAALQDNYETEDDPYALPWMVARLAAQAAWDRLAGPSREGMRD